METTETTEIESVLEPDSFGKRSVLQLQSDNKKYYLSLELSGELKICTPEKKANPYTDEDFAIWSNGYESPAYKHYLEERQDLDPRDHRHDVPFEDLNGLNHLRVHSNGLLQILLEGTEVVWQKGKKLDPKDVSRTSTFLKLHNDGNLVLYHQRRAMWASLGNEATLPLGPARPYAHKLQTLEWLDSGGECLVSKNNKYYACLQKDGNFAVYYSNDFTWENQIWSTETDNDDKKGSYKLYIQHWQGDLRLVDASNQNNVYWSSGTRKYSLKDFPKDPEDCRCSLVMRDDGNLVLQEDYGSIRWETGTSGMTKNRLAQGAKWLSEQY